MNYAFFIKNTNAQSESLCEMMQESFASNGITIINSSLSSTPEGIEHICNRKGTDCAVFFWEDEETLVVSNKDRLKSELPELGFVVVGVDV